MRQSTRLIGNALISYGRMFLTVGLGLWTTRLVLKSLGAADFGLYAVLTSVTGFLSSACIASSASVQRHLAVEIGRGNALALKRVFATSVVIHLVAAVVVALAGLFVRMFVISFLNMPAGRSTAAGVAFDMALIAAVAGVAVAPVGALYSARQRMGFDAAFALLMTMGALGVALLLPHLMGDPLQNYARWQIAVQVLVLLLQVVVAGIMFHEARITPGDIDAAHYRPLLALAGWSMLGGLGWMIRMGGGGVLLNLFFGPVVNAGYAIAQQATTYVLNFSNVILRSVQPAMSTLEGRGRPEQFTRLMYATGKLMLLASSIIAIPLIVAPDLVLTVWLGHQPEGAANFMRLVLISVLILQSTVGHETAMIATGRVRVVAAGMFWIMVLPLPLAAASFRALGGPPAVYGLLLVATAAMAAIYYVHAANAQLDESMGRWLRAVPARVLFAVVCGALAASAVAGAVSENLLGIAAVTVSGSVVVIGVAWLGVLGAEERAALREFVSHGR